MNSNHADVLKFCICCTYAEIRFEFKRALATFAIFVLTHLSIGQAHAQSFDQIQLDYRNVSVAAQDKNGLLRGLVESEGLEYPPARIFIRVFKKERTLELWAGDAAGGKFRLLRTYAFCSSSGRLGPKRVQGDGQIPEGFYYIDQFNPQSSFLLSLGLNYPNSSDLIKGDKIDPGSAIFIHGGCASIGCIPITDDKIKEVYWLAVQSKSQGQNRIPVHIFPTIMSAFGMDTLYQEAANNRDLMSFWENIRPAFSFFEDFKSVPTIAISASGNYIIPIGPDKPTPLRLWASHVWGDDVEIVQRALAGKGLSVSIDSIYGPNTETAVKYFQRQQGLADDGIVGPATRTALGLQ